MNAGSRGRDLCVEIFIIFGDSIQVIQNSSYSETCHLLQAQANISWLLPKGEYVCRNRNLLLVCQCLKFSENRSVQSLQLFTSNGKNFIYWATLDLAGQAQKFEVSCALSTIFSFGMKGLLGDASNFRISCVHLEATPIGVVGCLVLHMTRFPSLSCLPK